MSCKNCIHAEVCGLRDQLGEYAEQCEYFFKKIPKPHGRLIDADQLKRNQGVFVKGIKMPRCCGECPLTTNTRRCVLLWAQYGNPDLKLKGCPLCEAEVSNHA